MLAYAEGAGGGVYAGVYDVPEVVLGEAAVVLDEGKEVVFGEAGREREAGGAERGEDREGLADAGTGGAGARPGLVVEAAVLAVGSVVLCDGAHGTITHGSSRARRTPKVAAREDRKSVV